MTREAPSLTAEEKQQLTEEISAALEYVIDHTCRDMAPLYLDATRSQRAPIGEVTSLPFTPSARFLALAKGSRSKYRQLAAWRHAVVWQQALKPLTDPDFQRAVNAIYFTPFPTNNPPYAWSSSASAAPDVGAFPSATTLKEWARNGAWHTVDHLRSRVHQLDRGGTYADEVTAALLKPGCRDTLSDVLKLEELPPWNAHT